MLSHVFVDSGSQSHRYWSIELRRPRTWTRSKCSATGFFHSVFFGKHFAVLFLTIRWFFLARFFSLIFSNRPHSKCFFLCIYRYSGQFHLIALKLNWSPFIWSQSITIQWLNQNIEISISIRWASIHKLLANFYGKKDIA